MICPICHSQKVSGIQHSGAWAKCSGCGCTDLIPVFWRCPYKGIGCSQEDDCKKYASLVENCNLFGYMQFLWEAGYRD